MPSVVFVCPSNAARSPLAEAIANQLAPGLDVFSAGVRPTHVRPHVRTVLVEEGFRAEGLRAKSLYEVPLDEVTHVVSLSADTALPPLPRRVAILRWNLPDPASAPPDEALEAYRATRDELMRRLPGLLRDLGV